MNERLFCLVAHIVEFFRNWWKFVWGFMFGTSEDFQKAERAYYVALQANIEARRVKNKARRAYDEACRAYDKAVIKNKSKIEALHAEECPNCPWDGHTIFPNA